MTYQLDNIMKKINISEDKLKKALREIFKEEVLNGEYADNQHPFGREGTPEEGVEDGHGYGIVGNTAKGDQTQYNPTANIEDYGVKGNGMA